MIARGQFHIKFSDLIRSIFKLVFSDFNQTDKVSRFRNELKNHFMANDIELFSSCRIAFDQFLKSKNIEKGSEVLLCPVTIPDMINALIINGLKPVFVEMNLSNHSFCIEDLKSKISSKTCMILNTNLSGLNNLSSEVYSIAKNENLLYVDDISQAPVENYFEHDFAAEYAVVSMSIGKTITSLVGGVLISKKESLRIDPLILSKGKRSYFIRQIFENLKIDLLTSSTVYRFFTRHILFLLSRISPSTYLSIHLTNTISKYSERDIFFDDIPVLRKSFPNELYFPFSNWMAWLGQRTLKNWGNVLRKRSINRKVFLDNCSSKLKSMIAQNFIDEDYFPTRVPIYTHDVERLSLYGISKGLDMGTYGLNNCSEELVFDKFSVDLPVSRYIKTNCVFLNLSEKTSTKDLLSSIYILNDYFEGELNEDT